MTYQICFGDSDGDEVSVVVSGLPISRSQVSRSGDSAFLTLYLMADSLEYDSLYTIRISASAGVVDTMTITRQFMALDTNRIGGIRKLTKGMWWVTEKYDTTISVKDSTIDSTSTQRIIVSDTTVHRVGYLVANGLVLDGFDYWQVLSADTNKDDNSVKLDTTYVRHNATAYDVLTSVGGVDTAWARAYTLPIRAGASWSVVDKSVDTTIRVNWGPFASPRFTYAMEGTARGEGMVSPVFGGVARKALEVTGSSAFALAALADATVDLGYDTVNVGDTLVDWTTTTDTRTYVCPDLGIGLWSSSVTITSQRNRLEQVVQNDTTRSSAGVIAIYDPRRGAGVLR